MGHDGAGKFPEEAPFPPGFPPGRPERAVHSGPAILHNEPAIGRAGNRLLSYVAQEP